MRGTRTPVLASCLALLASAFLPAAAPAWEWVYGPAATFDDAFRRVTPVPACGGLQQGYIAVGTQDPGAVGDADVYVVRTNVLGNSAPLWEATYDIQGLGLQDEGMAIVPVPGGYVFLSNSLNGVWRPALTMIGCNGNVLWSRFYPDAAAGQNLRGNDLIRLQTGNPAANPPTNVGDLAVAGRWFNGANDDAFLMRTTAAGVLIWNITHDVGLPEAFNALAEALPVAPEPAADLVAVGRLTTTTGDSQGLVARVNGNNGTIGAAPQCMQHHGLAAAAEVYNSVRRLQVFFPGQFAIVGTSTNATAAGWLDDFWVTRGNSCGLTAQARFGNPGGVITSEHGHDIIELQLAKPGAPAGSLVAAGDHGPAIGGPYDAATVVLNPGLVPLAGQHRLFGDFGAFDETFFSLAEDPGGWPIPAGFVLAGLTQRPIGGDPQDMYLVHDDPAVLACELPWNAQRVTTGVPQVNLTPQFKRPARHVQVPTPFIFQLNGIQICAP